MTTKSSVQETKANRPTTVLLIALIHYDIKQIPTPILCFSGCDNVLPKTVTGVSNTLLFDLK